MTTDELIAKQALRIAELEEYQAAARKAKHDVLGLMYCIGGPLNDNVRQYTKSQLGDFFRLERFIDAL